MEEIKNIKQLLIANNFPIKFINRQIHTFLQKKQIAEPKIIYFGPKKKKKIVCLFPFVVKVVG